MHTSAERDAEICASAEMLHVHKCRAGKELTGMFSCPGAGCDVAVLLVRPARVAVLVSLCF